MKKKIILATILIINLAVFLCASLITILNSNQTFYYFFMLYKMVNNSKVFFNNGIIYFFYSMFLILPYLGIIALFKKDNNKIENSDKIIHFNFKFLSLLILIVSIICIFILPNNSGDVFYYIATGRMSSVYKINPYETSLAEARKSYPDDPVINNGYNLKATYAYGSAWFLISKILACIPTNSNALLLYIFKIANTIVYLLSCYLIFKLSLIHQKEINQYLDDKKLIEKQNKIIDNKFKINEIFDIFSLKQINKSIITTLIYALNPLIIVSLLINCHNDTYVIFFILLAFYLKKRNKTLLAVLSLTLGTLIKYFPIMFLPYILNKEKSKAKAILYFLMSILIFVGVTFISTGSIKNLTAFLTQAVLYNSSIFVWILTFTNSNFDLVKVLAKIGKIIFVILYLSVLIYFYTMEKKKNVEIAESKKMNIYNILLFTFLLLATTCLRSWYFTWPFIFIPFWDLEKDQLKISAIENISITIVMFSIIIALFGDGYYYTKYIYALSIIFSLILTCFDYIHHRKKIKEIIS